MIVVTGAAGRLGGLVVRRLVDSGYEVLATDRVAPDESPAEFIRNDLGDPTRVGQMLQGAEGVIHMGAIPGPMREEPRQIFEPTFPRSAAWVRRNPVRVLPI